MRYLFFGPKMPKLTRKFVEALEPADAAFCVWDTQVTGFGVRVRPSGGRSYVLFYRLGGQSRKLTLGRADGGYGLEEARDRAMEKLQLVREGVDPQAAKVAERNALTISGRSGTPPLCIRIRNTSRWVEADTSGLYLRQPDE